MTTIHYETDIVAWANEQARLVRSRQFDSEKGLFFTTGYFTAQAKQAARDGNSSLVELIDGERLIDLLEQHSFGLREIKTF